MDILKTTKTLASRRIFTIVAMGILSFAGSWLVAEHRGIPVPYIHDEFSYLLQADTFAHGRLTNPTPPMWEHFETFHELMSPTYTSKFLPGQGLFLAIGQVLFRQPIVGVWISTGLMCIAICWMLYGWLSPRWALIGGLVGVLQFGVFTYWSQSYWGGGVAALGGALVFGALPRIFKYQRTTDAIWLGLGIAVLANTRPLEGLIVGIPFGVLVLPWKIKWQNLDKQKWGPRIILPLSLIVLMTLIGIGVYNKAVTGDARIFPSLLYSKTYSSVPLIVWKPLRPPVQFNHPVMAKYEQGWVKDYYTQKRTWPGFIKAVASDGRVLFNFFFGYPLAVPSLVIMLLMFCSRKRAWRFILALLIVMVTCAAIIYRTKAHYFAVLTCLAVLLITHGLRFLSLSFLKHRLGLIIMILLMAFQLAINIGGTPVPPAVMSLGRITQATQIEQGHIFTRQGLKDFLLGMKGKHLVIISYFPGHIVNREWVYNDADIDHSAIVWARDMGTYKNAELLRYFKDRQVWYVDVFWDRNPAYFLYDKR